MSDRTKKILFAVFFILFSTGMGYALYLLFFVKPSALAPQPTTPTAPSTFTSLPSSGAGAPGAVTAPPTAGGGLPPSGGVTPPAPTGPVTTHLLFDGLTQDVSAAKDGNGVRFYNPVDGRFYVVNPDGTTTALSDRQFFNVSNAAWANKNDQVILTFPDGSKLFYDFTQKKQVTLPDHWQDFQFSKDDQSISAKSIGVDPTNRFLFVAKPDGSEAKAIEPLGDNSNQVFPTFTPDNQIVAYTTTGDPQENNAQEILFVGQNHENFNALIAPGQDFLPNWSPTGKGLLFSVWNQSSSGKPELWMSAGQASNMGNNRTDLKLQTWADKCAWSGDTTLYCGVPQNLPINAGMDRNSYTTYSDDIYKVDLQNGTITKINTPDQNHPVSNPVVSADKKQFIFTDAGSGKLYSYLLP